MCRSPVEAKVEGEKSLGHQLVPPNSANCKKVRRAYGKERWRYEVHEKGKTVVKLQTECRGPWYIR